MKSFAIFMCVVLFAYFGRAATISSLQEYGSDWTETSGTKTTRYQQYYNTLDTTCTAVGTATAVDSSGTHSYSLVGSEMGNGKSVAPGAVVTMIIEEWDSYSNVMVSWQWQYADSTPVPVSKLPQSVSISPKSATVTVGDSLTFLAQGGADSGYSWGGETSGTGASKVVRFDSVGERSVTVQHPGNSTYDASNTDNAVISVKALPTANISVGPSPATVIAGSGATAVVSWESTGASEVVVSGPSGFSAVTLNGSATTPSLGVGIHTFSISAKNSAGREVQAHAVFTVIEAGKANQTVTVSPSNANIYSGDTVSFTATGGVDSGYVWGGFVSGTGASKSATFSSPGTYTVTVSHPGGASTNPSNTAASSIVVSSRSASPGSDLAEQSIAISPTSTEVRAGSSVTFTVSGGIDDNYVWGGPASGTGASKTITFDTAGAYLVSVYHPGDENTQHSATVYSYVVVTGVPRLSQVLAIDPSSTTVKDLEPIEFSVSGGFGSGDYNWSLPGYVRSPALSKAEYRFEDPGVYYVMVSKSGDYDYLDSNTATACVTVTKTPVPYEPALSISASPGTVVIGSPVEILVSVATTDETEVLDRDIYKRIVWNMPVGWSEPEFKAQKRNDRYTSAFAFSSTPTAPGVASISVTLETMNRTLTKSVSVVAVQSAPSLSADCVYGDGRVAAKYTDTAIELRVSASSMYEKLSYIEVGGSQYLCSGEQYSATHRIDYNYADYLAKRELIIRAISESGKLAEIKVEPRFEPQYLTVSVQTSKEYYAPGEEAAFTSNIKDQFGQTVVLPCSYTVTVNGSEYCDADGKVVHFGGSAGAFFLTEDLFPSPGQIGFIVAAEDSRLGKIVGSASAPVFTDGSPICQLLCSPSSIKAPDSTTIMYWSANVVNPKLTGPGLSISAKANSMYVGGSETRVESFDMGSAGMYTYTLSGLDLRGNAVSAAAKLLVRGDAQPTLSIGLSNPNGKVGEAFTLTAIGGAGQGEYVWGGGASGNSVSTIVTFEKAGYSEFSVFKKGDGNYEQSNTATAKVWIYQGVQAPLKIQPEAATIKVGEMVELTAVGGTGAGLLRWSYPLGEGGATRKIVADGLITYMPGTNIIKVRKDADADYQQSDSAISTITVVRNPQSVSLSVDKAVVLPGADVYLGASTGSGSSTYAFSGPGVSVSTTSPGCRVTVPSVDGVYKYSVQRLEDYKYSASNVATVEVEVASSPRIWATPVEGTSPLSVDIHWSVPSGLVTEYGPNAFSLGQKAFVRVTGDGFSSSEDLPLKGQRTVVLTSYQPTETKVFGYVVGTKRGSLDDSGTLAAYVSNCGVMGWANIGAKGFTAYGSAVAQYGYYWANRSGVSSPSDLGIYFYYGGASIVKPGQSMSVTYAGEEITPSYIPASSGAQGVVYVSTSGLTKTYKVADNCASGWYCMSVDQMGMWYYVDNPSIPPVFTASSYSGNCAIIVHGKTAQNIGVTADLLNVNPSATVAVHASGGIDANYIWSCSGGAIVGSGADVSWIAPSTEGQFTISVKHPGNANYAESSTATVAITVKRQMFTLQTYVSGDGSVSAGGSFSAGSVVTALATPSATARFLGWSGSSVSAANPLSVVMDSDKSITANFAAKLTQFITVSGPNTLRIEGGVGWVDLTASSSSGLPVTLSVVSGSAIINGSRLEVTGAGPVVVQADQRGNDFYLPALPVTFSIEAVEDASIHLNNRMDKFHTPDTSGSTFFVK